MSDQTANPMRLSENKLKMLTSAGVHYGRFESKAALDWSLRNNAYIGALVRPVGNGERYALMAKTLDQVTLIEGIDADAAFWVRRG